MFISSDSLWNVSVIDDISRAVFPAADFSILPISAAENEAKDLTGALENMPAVAHVSLIIPRAVRVDPRTAFAAVAHTSSLPLLAVVSLTYDKPSRYSSVIMSPITETGFLVYKGAKPDISATGWFQGEQARDRGENATTHWDLTRYVTGKFAVEPAQQTTQGRFSWDLGLLMASLAESPRYNRFIYGFDPNDENLMAFVKAFGIACHVFTSTQDGAMKLLSTYEKIKNPSEEPKK